MKRMISGLLVAIMVLSVATMTAFAAGPRCGRNFVDADGDGICDNAGSFCAYVDEDGDGVCDNCDGEHRCGNGRGENFVDADGDGICDNYVPGQGRGGRCAGTSPNGRGNGCRGGRAR